jgi:hypothetical protein
MAEHKYICGNCNKEFIRNYIVSKPRNGAKTKNGEEKYKTYCSKECRIKERAKERTYKECLHCKNPYYYHKSLENKFCSNKCKGEWYKLNSQLLQLAERANKAREFRDENSIKKGLETRKKNGNIIDWDKAGWKQYWKRCDWLTRKIRKQMLENWNGYDYISGEYIKDNLNLHYSHGSYPTLDHIKPRSQCFREGLSPYEATKPENLAWTTRKNNSKKSQNKLEK